MKHRFFICAALVSLSLSTSMAQQHTYKPKNGYVPTAAVAIKIAIAVWEQIYGTESIAKQAPYRASLANGVWVVEGSLPAGKYVVGGAAFAEIAQDDGRVLSISHGK